MSNKKNITSESWFVASACVFAFFLAFFIFLIYAVDTDDRPKSISNDKFSLSVGSKMAKINDDTIELQAPVIEIDGYSYVPIRFILDWFNAENINYDPSSEQVTFNLKRFEPIDPLFMMIYKNREKNKTSKEEKPVTAINENKLKEEALAYLKRTSSGYAKCHINENRKAFTITPDDYFMEAVRLASQSNGGMRKVWHNSVAEYKELSIAIHKKVPGYSLDVVNPLKPDQILFSAIDGAVLVDVVLNP